MDKIPIIKASIIIISFVTSRNVTLEVKIKHTIYTIIKKLLK